MVQKPPKSPISPENDKSLKYLKIILFGVILAILSIGAMAAYYAFFSSSSVSFSVKSSCEYNGVKYKHGAEVPSGDSCNTCSCNDGDVACTLMFCDDSPL